MNFICPSSILFSRKKHHSNQGKIWSNHRFYTINFSCIEVVYFISLWSHKHVWRRTFSTPNWGRCKRNSWLDPSFDELHTGCSAMSKSATWQLLSAKMQNTRWPPDWISYLRQKLHIKDQRPLIPTTGEALLVRDQHYDWSTRAVSGRALSHPDYLYYQNYSWNLW